ncbi:MAG: PAS domain-containing protein [FCB group bacterium]|nr:PAS domain-containing protein [FCB group bacterium]
MLYHIRHMMSSLTLRTAVILAGCTVLPGLIAVYAVYSRSIDRAGVSLSFVLISFLWLTVYVTAVGVVIFMDRRRSGRVGKSVAYRNIVDQCPDSIMILDLEGRIEYVNRFFCDCTGYSPQDVIGESPSSFTIGKNSDRRDDSIWQAITSGNSWTGLIKYLRKNGEPYRQQFSITPIVDDRQRMINYLVVGEEDGDEAALQEQLTEVEKRSAVGLLAAGVAHEYKNLLCGIIGNASYLLDSDRAAQTSAEVRETLTTIINIGERADDLTTKLLTYSQTSIDSFEAINLQALVTDTLALIRPEMIEASIEIITNLENIPEIECARGRIQQLLLSLLVNARQAIGTHGKIIISLDNEDESVWLRVTDTGRGIPKAIINRIFDPFFSTKGVWGKEDVEGLGLGLAVCRNIARDHGGEIRVNSEIDTGTEVIVRLPINRDSSKTGSIRKKASIPV